MTDAQRLAKMLTTDIKDAIPFMLPRIKKLAYIELQIRYDIEQLIANPTKHNEYIVAEHNGILGH